MIVSRIYNCYRKFRENYIQRVKHCHHICLSNQRDWHLEQCHKEISFLTYPRVCKWERVVVVTVLLLEDRSTVSILQDDPVNDAAQFVYRDCRPIKQLIVRSVQHSFYVSNIPFNRVR